MCMVEDQGPKETCPHKGQYAETTNKKMTPSRTSNIYITRYEVPPKKMH